MRTGQVNTQEHNERISASLKAHFAEHPHHSKGTTRINARRAAKKCSSCKEEKPREEFGRLTASPDGLGYVCTTCRKELERRRGPSRQLERLYGITLEQYEAMLEAQDGVCKICGSPPGRKRLHVDHCHVTKVVRGLLCSPCNTALGAFKDDEELLERAIAYLRGSLAA